MPDPLCAVECLARLQELGNRLRGVFGTFTSSCSFHPGWKQEIVGLVGWVTDCLWTRSSCGVRQRRTVFGGIAFLCSAADSAAIGGGDLHHSVHGTGESKSNQEESLVEGAGPNQ